MSNVTPSNEDLSPVMKSDRPQIGVIQGVDPEAVVAGIRVGSPAEKAGIEAGWTVTAVNGKAVGTWASAYVVLAPAPRPRQACAGRGSIFSIVSP